MSVIIDQYKKVFDALLNPNMITGAIPVLEGLTYDHIVDNNKILETEYINKLHDYILSKEFINYQKDKLKLLLGIFIFRNPFDVKEKPFYLLGGRNSFAQKNEKPSFLLQPHYFANENNSQVYKIEPHNFINRFLELNLNDRQRNAATDQDFFIHIEDTNNLSKFEQDNEIYYIPSGEFDFCLLQWLFLLIRKYNDNQRISLNEKYDLLKIISLEHHDINLGAFFNEPPRTLKLWLRKFGLLIDDNLSERGEALFYWLSNLLHDDGPQEAFSVNKELKTIYKLESKATYDLIDLIEALNSLSFGFDENEAEKNLTRFTLYCRFRLPIHFIIRYAPRHGGIVENACRGLFALNAFKQRSLNNENNKLYENVGFYLGLFKDSTIEGKNYVMMSENPEVKEEFIALLNNYKLLIKILGEVEFREIYHKNVLLKQYEDIKNETRKSAIAAVMSRCLSHYNGSHILPDVRNYYKKIPRFDHLSREYLTQYLDFTQNRMELIADITLSEDLRSSFIFSIYEDVIMPFQRYLLGPGLGLFDAFHNKTRNFLTIKLNYLKFDKKTVRIPGGQLGISAFYLILENVIRNYYKHSNKVPGRNYEFVMEVTEPEEEALRKRFWCIDVFDAHGSINLSKRKSLNSDGVYALLQRLQDYIDKPVIDPLGKLRPDGWGFIEMKAAASYLINYRLDKIDEALIGLGRPSRLIEIAYYEIDYKTNKMSRRFREDAPKNAQFNLGFRFYIKKEKKILIDKTAYHPETVMKKGGIISPRNSAIDITDINAKNFKQYDHDIIVTNKRLPSSNRRIIKTVIRQYSDVPKLEAECWKFYTDSLSIKETNVMLHKPSGKKIIPQFLNVAIDDHGSEFKNSSFNSIKEQGFDTYFTQSDEFPSFPPEILTCSNNKDKQDDCICRSPYRVKETALISISVFDERIQNDVNRLSENQPNLTFRDLHDLSGIFIPVKSFLTRKNYEIDPIDLDKVNKKNKNTFRELFEKRLSIDHFVIIHYTLFERIIPENSDYEKYLNELTKKYSNKLVFCSGSVRHNSNESNLFINLSTLQNVLVNRPSKFELVNILKSL